LRKRLFSRWLRKLGDNYLDARRESSQITAKSKALLVWSVLFFLTALVTIFRELEAGYNKGIWAIWAFCSWNFFAYGFDKGMWPRAFIELDGGGNGKQSHRNYYFWLTAVIYLAFLATMAFAN
jgi:hypothetical protein